MRNSKHKRSISWNFQSPSGSPRFSNGQQGDELNLLRQMLLKKGLQLPPSVLPSQSLRGSPQSSVDCLPRLRQSDPKAAQQSKRSTRQSSTTSEVTNAISKCAYKSRTGIINKIPKKANQDSFLIKPYLQGIKGQYLFAVCDGHGVNGHLISQLVKEKLGCFLQRNLRQNLEYSLQQAIKNTIESLQRSGIDHSFSGTTLTAVLVRGSTLCCANIGDSRTVLGQKTDQWRAINLSRDHKPNLPQEYSRILRNNGSVRPCTRENGQPVGVDRVWMKNERFPGLAMSRSIGDSVAAMVGVSCEPEFMIYSLQSCDKFVVLASDGIWEFISSQEAVNIIGNAFQKGNANQACEILVRQALNRWGAFSDNVDDITVIVIFLSHVN